MNKKTTELEKEERTIFIVLAIIVMIAIGVLVTWYFTKDKEDVKDTDNTSKTVDKQKKKNINSDTTKSYTITYPVKKEVQEEITIIQTSNEISDQVKVEEDIIEEDNTNNSEEVETDNNVIYSENNNFYIVGETLNFNGSVVSNKLLNNVKIIKVEKISTPGITEDDTNQYSLKNGNIIFNEEGSYQITILNENEEEIIVDIQIISSESFELIYSNIITTAENFISVENIKYYDETLWNNVVLELENLKNIQSDITSKRTLYQNFEKLFNDLISSKNLELELQDKKDELSKKVEEIKKNYLEENYTTESYLALKELLVNCEDELNLTSAELINELIIKLDEAILNLEEQVVNTEEVNTNPDSITTMDPVLSEESLENQVKVDTEEETDVMGIIVEDVNEQ